MDSFFSIALDSYLPFIQVHRETTGSTFMGRTVKEIVQR
jgi:hypothetical protein